MENQFPRLVLSRFQNIKCPSFAANDNFCLSSKLISVQLHTCHSFTTNDWQGYKGLVYRRCVWRYVWFGQNLWSCDKPSALVKCSWWKKICLNKQLSRQCVKALIIILNLIILLVKIFNRSKDSKFVLTMWWENHNRHSILTT